MQKRWKIKNLLLFLCVTGKLSFSHIRSGPFLCVIVQCNLLRRNAYIAQVTAVGHAAMLAAIQRYVPALVCIL